MNESNHLCPCQQCGGTIEFSDEAVGQAVDCPHCGQQTVLFIPPPEETLTLDESMAAIEPQPPKRGRSAIALLALAVVAVAAVVAGTIIFRGKSTRSRPEPVLRDNTTADEIAATAEPPVLQTNSSAPAKTSKSMDDLKVGAIALEKTKGSSLVYAVGVLRNDSDQQRFGINLELELADAQGNKAGTAKDYRAVLEPRQTWRFRALVLDAKAVSAKVAAIREE